MDIAEQIKQTFIDETEELLYDLEGMLLDLETDPENSSHLDSVFRLIHTIKGSSGMVGEDDIYKFSHMVEDVFDSIRKGELQFSSDIADMALTFRDIILSLLKGEDEEETERKIAEVKAKIGELTSGIVKKTDRRGDKEEKKKNTSAGVIRATG